MFFASDNGSPVPPEVLAALTSGGAVTPPFVLSGQGAPANP